MVILDSLKYNHLEFSTKKQTKNQINKSGFDMITAILFTNISI